MTVYDIFNRIKWPTSDVIGILRFANSIFIAGIWEEIRECKIAYYTMYISFKKMLAVHLYECTLPCTWLHLNSPSL